jgi:hypothetical protein
VQAVGFEVGRLRVGGVVTWGGEVDVPEGVEGADVHCDEGMGEQGDDEVAGPDAAEWEHAPRGFVGGEFVVCEGGEGGLLEFHIFGMTLVGRDSGVAVGDALAEDVAAEPAAKAET